VPRLEGQQTVGEATATGTTSAARGGVAVEPFPSEAAADLFTAYARRARPGLEAALTRYLDRVTASVRHLPGDVQATVDTVRVLALRGGKRLRAVLMAAAYESCGGKGGPEAVVMAGVSLELLQAYLLIHDDWMDADDVRRGGPSVPAMLRAHFGGRPSGAVGTADASAILAGDFAAGLSLDALAELPLAPDRVAAAAGEMGRIQRDVVLGQMCDLTGAASLEPPTEAAVELTHSLKTGSYTVRGPLALGAHLAGAGGAVRGALDAFAHPLGVAFQLRDDLIGTFGDPAHTGKSSTGDLREGKRTGLVAALVALEPGPETAVLLARGFGKADADPADVEALVDRLMTSGAKHRVEQRIDALLAEAVAILNVAPLPPAARDLLRGAACALGHRET
jgi:geranylgeranyl diphosphate synthase type I